MKIADEYLHFQAWPNRPASFARMRVYSHAGQTVAVVTELAANPGASITNGAEAVHARLVDIYGPAVVHVEHYGPESYTTRRWGVEPDRFDLVTVDGAVDVRWQPVSDEKVTILCGEPVVRSEPRSERIGSGR